MIGKINIEDIGIIKKFIDECMSFMGDIEKEILQLETNSDDITLYGELYKNINKISRGSSFFGLSALANIAYEMKFIIGRIMDPRGAAITDLIDNLLLSLDFLSSYMSRLGSRLEEVIIDNEQDKYIEIETSPRENQILNDLRVFHINCESLGSSELEQAAEKDNVYDDLIPDNLQNTITENVKEQFIYESEEHLELIENDILIRLSNDKNDREAINEVFRAVHTIKGGAGIYLSTLSSEDPYYKDTKKFLEVVHSFEDLLSMVRDRQCAYDKNLVDLSYKAIDFLKSCIQFIGLGEGKIENYKSILDSINIEVSNIGSLPANIGLNQSNMGSNGQNDITINQKTKKQSENIKHKENMIQTIRVRQDKIDTMMNMISELVIAKNSFAHISDKLNMEYNLPEISKEIKQVGSYVNRISDELQNSIMSVRMVEISTIFQKMPRVVRDIANNTGKNIELIIEGEDTEIDKTIIEHISDPLVHMIRNCADHGIETYEERIKLGKPGKGKITLRAYNKNKYVFVEVEDDGKGIDPIKIKKKAIEKGIISEADAEKMNNSQIINLIFLPGFSTAEKITEISGRGVGMDIVKSNISKINGSITVESEAGKGTKMIVRLPLSLAISNGLIVEAEGSNYIIPLENIVETVKIRRNCIHHLNEKYFTNLRGNVIGIEWLSKIFLQGERNLEKEELNAVILSNGAENFAIIVDRLKNEQEFVMKPLEGHLSSIPGISGSTILGDGKVVLIVNPSELIKMAEL